MPRRKKEQPEECVFGPRPLKDGREAWDVRWRDERGKNKSRTYYSLREANELALDIRFGRDNSDLLESVTLKEYFDRDEVKERIIRERRLGKKTRKQWADRWDLHVRSKDYGIAHVQLQELSRKAPISDWLAGMTEAGVPEQTQARVLGQVSKVLDEAVEDGLMPRNPIRTLDKRAKPSTKRLHPVYIPTLREAELLRFELLRHPNHLRKESYAQRDALMVSLLAYEAPRPEELRLLGWDKMLYDQELVHLHSPKAERGKSTVLDRTPPLQPVVAAEARAWWMTLGEPDEHTLVIPLPAWDTREAGGVWEARHWNDWRRRVFHPACDRVADKVAKTEAHRLALHRVRPYDLRHMAISLWLANGGKDRNGEWDGSPANPVEVARWAGHQIYTMFSTYAHFIETAPRVPINQQIEQAREDVFGTQLKAAT